MNAERIAILRKLLTQQDTTRLQAAAVVALPELLDELERKTAALKQELCPAHIEDPEADFHVHDSLGYFCEVARVALEGDE